MRRLPWLVFDRKGGRFLCVAYRRERDGTLRRANAATAGAFWRQGAYPTAQGRFHVAHQEVGESLDNWSDRALKLATAAFRDLPYAYAAEQAVTKFCHGLIDEEAGKHVSLQLPTSMGDAMNMLKIYSHVQSACGIPRRLSKKSQCGFTR
jgi:hypothetical protein